MASKKAITVDVNLKVRVVVNDTVDPNTDPEFEEAVTNSVRGRLAEEGISFIAEGINDFNDDKETPFDPEYDG